MHERNHKCGMREEEEEGEEEEEVRSRRNWRRWVHESNYESSSCF